MYSKADCSNCLKAKDSIFNVLTDKELEILKANKTCSTYKKGEIIFKEGDKPVGLVCLCKGKAKIFKEGVGGREQIIRMAQPVAFIGFRALFADDNYNASSGAIEESAICTIEKSILLKLIKSNSSFALEIIHYFAHELGTSNQRTIALTQKHIRGRLADALLFLIDTYGFQKETKDSDIEETGRIINVFLSREDIAGLSNMTTSNAIRTLSTFASENVISLSGRKIGVFDVEVLRKISSVG